MANPASTFVSKLMRKLMMAVLIAGLTLLAYGLWLYGKERAGYGESRSRLVAAHEETRRQVADGIEEAERQRKASEDALEALQKRAALADKTLKGLHELEPGTIERLFGDEEKRKAHEAQVARVKTIQAEVQTQMTENREKIAAAVQARAELVRQQAEVEETLLNLGKQKDAAGYYARQAWTEARWLVLAVVLVYLLGGVVTAFLLYYGWAGWVGRGRELRLSEENAALPVIGESAMAVEESLWPGEVLWVRRNFLQTNDDGLARKSRLTMSWRSFFSCRFAGLWRMVELRNGRSDGARHVVMACKDDPFAELAVVSVPEGAAFVLRAGFLMGLIATAQQPPVFRRHWRFNRWQPWVSGQFGYIEFFGPCRLVVSCVSALKSETVVAQEGGTSLSKRTAHEGLIGFSPQLGLKAVRSHGFWRYCKGRGPLFEVQVGGGGVFLTREAEGRGRDGFWARVLKRWGL